MNLHFPYPSSCTYPYILTRKLLLVVKNNHFNEQLKKLCSARIFWLHLTQICLSSTEFQNPKWERRWDCVPFINIHASVSKCLFFEKSFQPLPAETEGLNPFKPLHRFTMDAVISDYCEEIDQHSLISFYCIRVY